MKLLLLSTMLLSLKSFAGDYSLEKFQIFGTGCKSGQTSLTLSPDKSVASIIFSAFDSSVPNLDPQNDNENVPEQRTINGRVVNRSRNNPDATYKMCNIKFEVAPTVGSQITSVVVKFDLRGNALFDQGILGKFSSALIQKLAPGSERVKAFIPLEDKIWDGALAEVDQDFTVQFSKEIPVSSDCYRAGPRLAESIHLQHYIGAMIMENFKSQNPQGRISLDSVDLSSGIKIEVKTQKCDLRNDPRNGGGSGQGRRICRRVVINGVPQVQCTN